jgi:hypothetical protein
MCAKTCLNGTSNACLWIESFALKDSKTGIYLKKPLFNINNPARRDEDEIHKGSCSQR